jgi:hypothetical protein
MILAIPNGDDGEIRRTVDRPTTADNRRLIGRRPDLARFGGDRRI